MATISKGSLFPPELEKDIFSLVKGHSSLAVLSESEPVPFVGKDIFTFNFSSDIAIVGENEEKPAGDGDVAPVSMQPIKVIYQMRTSDEFVNAAEEYQMSILKAFTDGFSKKLASGLDKMAIHGVNPKTGLAASSTIGNNCFDKKITNKVTVTDLTSIDVDIDSAVALVEIAEYTCNGIAISSSARTAIAKLDANGQRKYPDFAFGGAPENLGSMKLDVNATVSSNASKDRVLVGDFKECFKWGIAKQLPIDIIEYGDPDGQGDLKAKNQVVIRSEAFIGWAIMDKNAFALIEEN